jgi:tetraacyldisaccharide-1-P 4'-kinase
LSEILKKSGAKTILTTEKDFVKIDKFGFKTEVLNLEIVWNLSVMFELDSDILSKQ